VQLNLKEALECYVDHRLDVIRRRAAFEMERAETRAHIVEGLLTALDDIDRVIEIIRGSTSPAVAADRLCAAFGLTQAQADAILAMRLARLTQLEGKKLLDELEDLKARIEELRHLVEEDVARRTLLGEELADLAARFGDERRTVVLDESQPFPLPSEDDTGSSLVLVSRHGYVKAQPVRGGRSEGLAGAEAMAEREGDFVTHAFLGRAETELLFFTGGGTVKSVTIGDLPIGTRSSRGRPLSELLEIEADDPIVAIHPVPDTTDERFVLTVSRLGQIKRTSLEEYGNVRGTGIIAAGLGDDDRLVDVHLTDGTADLVLGTRDGMMIRFDESEVRPMGRSAKGVKGIDLQGDDEVRVSATPHPDADLVLVTRVGRAKRFPLNEVREQGRAGKGVTVVPETERVGEVTGLVAVHGDAPLVYELASGSIAAGRAGALRTSDRRGAATVVRELQKLGDLRAVHIRLGGISTSGSPDPGEAATTSEGETAPTGATAAAEDAPDGDSVGASASQGELGLSEDG
jgi:DNA gyrase subunit A